MLTCVQKYYGSQLESSGDLQTSASSCSRSSRPVPKSVTDALSLVHSEVTKRYAVQSCLNFAFASYGQHLQQQLNFFFVHMSCTTFSCACHQVEVCKYFLCHFFCPAH